MSDYKEPSPTGKTGKGYIRYKRTGTQGEVLKPRKSLKFWATYAPPCGWCFGSNRDRGEAA